MTELAEFHRRIGEMFCNAICVAARLGHKRLDLTLSTYVRPSDDATNLIVDAFTNVAAGDLVDRSPILQAHMRQLVDAVGDGVSP